MDGKPARLRKLVIENFRGIDHLDLDFVGPDGAVLEEVVLAGDNGAGKTSVIEAILMALGLYSRVPARPIEDWVHFGAKDFLVRLTVEGADTYELAANRGSIPAFPETDPDSGTLVWKAGESPTVYAVRPDIQVEYFSAARDPELVDRALADVGQRLVNLYFREKGAPSSGGPFGRLQEVWSRLATDGRVLDVLQESDDPSSNWMVVLREPRPIPPRITSLQRAHFEARTHGDVPAIVPLRRLSDGQKMLLHLASRLVFRDRPADVVLFDEPEQHMHVGWQRYLIDVLRELSPTSQFIVATHSQEIIDAALDSERFILVEDSDPRARVVEHRPEP